eukprot:599221-Lingulodinium_polyedra.AAC.1
MREPLRPRTVDSTAFCSVFQTFRNDAVEPTVCGRRGPLIARPRAVRAPGNWRARRVRERAISEPLQRRT